MEKKIEKILDKIRPYIQLHGGDARLIKVEDGMVTIKLYGACIGCPLADMTYNKMLGSLIKDDVPGVKDIIFED